MKKSKIQKELLRNRKNAYNRKSRAIKKINSGFKKVRVKGKKRWDKIPLEQKDKNKLMQKITSLNSIIKEVNKDLKVKFKTQKIISENSGLEDYEFPAWKKSQAEDLINNSTNNNIDVLMNKLNDIFYKLTSNDVCLIQVNEDDYIKGIYFIEG